MTRCVPNQKKKKKKVETYKLGQWGNIAVVLEKTLGDNKAASKAFLVLNVTRR